MLNFIITLLIFSSMEVMSKPLMDHIDPMSLTFFRFIIGFVVIVPTSLLTGHIKELIKLKRNQIFLMAVAGFLNTFFSMTMLQMAVKAGAASTAALIFCSNPVFVYLFQILLKKEKKAAKPIIGLILAVFGLIVVLLEGLTFNIAAIYALFASFSFALYTIINKKVTDAVNPLNVNVVSFLFGLLFLSLFTYFSGEELILPAVILEEPGNLALFLYSGVIVSGIGYITFIATIKKYSAVSSSLIFLLKPVVAPILSIFILRELPGLFFAAGLILVSLGSILIVKR